MVITSAEPSEAHRQKRGGSATGEILRAALKLCEEIGLEALTMEGIAAHLGIAKTTIYRRWPNVPALMMNAVMFEVSTSAPIEERSTVRETFAASMKLLITFYESPQGKVLCALIGRAQVDTVLRHELQERWVEPRRNEARALIERAIGRGELRAGLNPDIMLDLLYGAIYHRLLVPYANAATTASFVEDVLDLAFGGLRGLGDP